MRDSNHPIMRLARIFSIIAVSALLLTGCDFVRGLLGKPTSKDIEALKMEQAARDKAVQDSIKAAKEEQEKVAQMLADSQEAKAKYYVILGSFLEYANANSFADRLQKLGYEPVKIDFKNGFRAVGVCGTDNLDEAYASMRKFIEKDFTPYDEPWVYSSTMVL